MIKVKTTLFEKVFIATIIPTALVIFFAPIYLISIFSSSSGN
jgi:cell division protein FtsL